MAGKDGKGAVTVDFLAVGQVPGYEDENPPNTFGAWVQWKFPNLTSIEPGQHVRVSVTWVAPTQGTPYTSHARYALYSGNVRLTDLVDWNQNESPGEFTDGGVSWRSFDYVAPLGGSSLQDISVCGFNGMRCTNPETQVPLFVADGVMLRIDSGTTTYAYDYHNRLTRAERVYRNPGQSQDFKQAVDYLYDVFGRRIGRSLDENGDGTPETVERFVYDGDNVVLKLDGTGAVERRYLYGPAVDQLLAAEDMQGGSLVENSLKWMLSDHQNTVWEVYGYSATPEPAGNKVLQSFEYDSFGKPDPGQAVAADMYDFLRHAGRPYDGATVLYYNRARWYQPSAQRFTSEDPMGLAAGDYNLYRYCGNTPTMYVDPSGREPITLAVCGITALVLGFLGRESLYHAADQYDAASKIYERPNWTQADVDELNATLGSAQWWHRTGNVLGGASFAFAAAPLAIAGGAAMFGGGMFGKSLAWAGFGAGLTRAAIGTYAGDPEVGLGSLATSYVLEAGFGGVNPFGAFGSLAGSFAGGAIEHFGYGGNFFGGAGWAWGGFVGSLLGGGAGSSAKTVYRQLRYAPGAYSARAVLRAAAISGLRASVPELIGAAGGGMIGYARAGTWEGALRGAQIGVFAGSIGLHMLRPTFIMQRLAWAANRRLLADPALFARLAGGQPRNLAWGNAVEDLVAQRVQDSWLLSRMFQHLQQRRPVNGRFQSVPDFQGRGLFHGINIDITTVGKFGTKFDRWYGPGGIVATY